jgi:hypothetical protein
MAVHERHGLPKGIGCRREAIIPVSKAVFQKSITPTLLKVTDPSGEKEAPQGVI